MTTPHSAVKRCLGQGRIGKPLPEWAFVARMDVAYFIPACPVEAPRCVPPKTRLSLQTAFRPSLPQKCIRQCLVRQVPVAPGLGEPKGGRVPRKALGAVPNELGHAERRERRGRPMHYTPVPPPLLDQLLHLAGVAAVVVHEASDVSHVVLWRGARRGGAVRTFTLTRCTWCCATRTYGRGHTSEVERAIGPQAYLTLCANPNHGQKPRTLNIQREIPHETLN